MWRGDPPTEGSERKMLTGWLDFHRSTLAMKCEGLDSEQLNARPLAPSALSLAGLLRHLAEVERTYFRRVFAGAVVEPMPFEDDPFREDDTVDYSAASNNDGLVALKEWHAELTQARLVISDVKSLTDTGESGLPMRFWLVKTLNEYARHNGHADLLRERIDSSVGE